MTDHPYPHPARDTRLILVDPAGTPMVDADSGRPVGLMLTHIPNADAAAPVEVHIEQQCDLGHWHRVARTPLPNYDGAWPAEM